jgi:hypothetical protein
MGTPHDSAASPGHRRRAALQRRWVAEMFEPFLANPAGPKARADLHDALSVACDINTWRLLISALVGTRSTTG